MDGRSNQEWLDSVYDKLLVKMRAQCQRVGTDIPYTPGKDGKYHDITETQWGSKDSPYGVRFWTDGFWPGMLWQMYHATGDESYRKAWPDGMAKMTEHFGGGDIRGWMIIDCMMNIPLLYWASEETGDPRFKKIAVNHAKTAQQYVVRPDGSCNQSRRAGL